MKLKKDGLTWETEEPAAIAAMINAGCVVVDEPQEEQEPQEEPKRRGRKPKAEQAEE